MAKVTDGKSGTYFIEKLFLIEIKQLKQTKLKETLSIPLISSEAIKVSKILV